MQANQLKATELRCGNIVEYNGMYLPIWGIVSAVIKMTDGYIIELFDGASTIDCKIEDLKPISLTEDILVKLGFEKTENPREMKYEDYSVLFLREIRFVICNYMENPPTVKVQFLHQLQNLYHSLTGEEITFKN